MRAAGDATSPSSLGEKLDDALARLLAQRPVLVALDFDGVLSPIVERPEQARPTAPSAAALRRLVGTDGVHVALVSGRSLADLRNVADPPAGVVLVASHGAEVDGAPPPDVPADLLARVTAAIEDVVARHPGTTVEHKPSAAVLHTRRAADDVAAAATSAALQSVSGIDGAHVIEGKRVVEVTVVRADKGTALRGLRERLGVRAVLYAGDDVTDENAFATLDPTAGDIGVKVGTGATAATHRVDGPAEVAVLLSTLAGLLGR